MYVTENEGIQKKATCRLHTVERQQKRILKIHGLAAGGGHFFVSAHWSDSPKNQFNGVIPKEILSPFLHIPMS
jgi:hypothetical protein